MKKYKGLKIFLGILGVYLIFILIINLIPPKVINKGDNPFIRDNDLPMLVAHRGGAYQNPENTMKAYKDAASTYRADMLETDIYMTKDNRLVLNHDGKLNRNSDIELFEGDQYDSNHDYKIIDYTYDELCKFNFGYQFELDGKRPYKDLVSLDTPNREKIIKDNDLSIPLLEDFLDYFYSNYKNMLFIIEIKDNNEVGKRAADMLIDLIENNYPEYKNNIIICTKHPKIEDYLASSYSDFYRGASMKSGIGFGITQILGVNLFHNPSVIAYQMPYQAGFNTLIKRAHKKNTAIQYYTVNERKEMIRLIDKGVDAIMTDDLKLLRDVLDKYNS